MPAIDPEFPDFTNEFAMQLAAGALIDPHMQDAEMRAIWYTVATYELAFTPSAWYALDHMLPGLQSSWRLTFKHLAKEVRRRVDKTSPDMLYCPLSHTVVSWPEGDDDTLYEHTIEFMLRITRFAGIAAYITIALPGEL